MWLFLPGGLLMPSIVPEGKGDPAFTNNGEWMMQVRARTRSHLVSFMDDYMEDGTYSEIEATPQMDYNFRFYTTHEALALAVAKSVLDIDYAKFKPTAERVDEKGKLLYEDGVEYHKVLNNIWSDVCKLGSPGGHYGAKSAINPNGYGSSKEYYKYYQRPVTKRSAWWDNQEDDYPTGSSFFDDELTMEALDNWTEKDQEEMDELTLAQVTIEIMSDTDLDVGQWFPFLTHAEDKALRAYAHKCAKVPKGDLEPVEQDLVEHYLGSAWDEEDDDLPPFEKTHQKPAQRRKQRGKRGRVKRGVTFN